ncbi:MAG: zinc-dependent alcohol dehydrogenase family protein [Anaerolineae bacterium]|jgi:propanol-preferring alcohol dehydrogenase
MKAVVLREPKPVEDNPLEMADLPVPEPSPGQVRLRVGACGVCHTDLHLVEGEIATPKLPVVPGHQIVGRVDALGEGVTRFAVGDRAGVPWLYSTCGECGYCQRGLENLCDNARFTGQHADGGFAEYMVVPADFAYSIPIGFPDDQAAPLLCAGIIGYRSLRLSEIEPGERLGLYGFGASAHVTIQVARHWGCEVYVFTRSEEHQRHARALGAAWVGQAQDTPPAELDSAITFAPAGWLVPEALRVLRKGGTLAINAIHMSPIPELPYPLLYGERTVRSVANSTRRDAEELLLLAAEIPIQTEVELYPLDQANAVLQRLKRAEVQGAAVLQVA